MSSSINVKRSAGESFNAESMSSFVFMAMCTKSFDDTKSSISVGKKRCFGLKISQAIAGPRSLKLPAGARSPSSIASAAVATIQRICSGVMM